MANLMVLNMSDNYISSLPGRGFGSLVKLSTLDLSNNTIVDVDNAFKGRILSKSNLLLRIALFCFILSYLLKFTYS